jgi:hypothetical protein
MPLSFSQTKIEPPPRFYDSFGDRQKGLAIAVSIAAHFCARKMSVGAFPRYNLPVVRSCGSMT